MFCQRHRCLALLLLLSLLPSLAMGELWNVKGKKIAVVVFTASKESAPYHKTAHVRLESMLSDNGAVVLDKEEADELKNVWNRLEDPGYFVTAEEFVENAGKYELDALLRVYLRLESVPGLVGYSTATAHIDARLVGKDASVGSQTSKPMGVPGSPASDGLTESSAIVNAVQRAVDDVCEAGGLMNLAPVTPYNIAVTLSDPIPMPGAPAPPSSKTDKKVAACVDIGNPSRGKSEKITCTAVAPGGWLAVAGGYKNELHRGGSGGGPKSNVDTGHSGLNTAMGAGAGFSRGTRMYYSSVAHLIDMKGGKEVNAFTAEELGTGGTGTRQLIACAFAENWRYLCGVTGRHVFLWDTQQGRCLDTRPLPSGCKPESVGFLSLENEKYLAVGASRGRKVFSYKIVKKH